MAAAEDDVFSGDLSAGERRRRAALRDGLAHGSRIFPRDPRPGAPVTLVFTSRVGLAVDLVAVYYTTDGSEPRGERGVATHGAAVEAEAGAAETDPATTLQIREWRATLPGQPEGTLVRYRAEGWSVRGERRVWYADYADPVSGPQARGRVFAYHVDTIRVPDWFDDAIIYHIQVDRFSAGADEPPVRDPGTITGFFGGTLAGVLERLEYLRELGVNCLWLSPVMESPSYHGYDPASDYYVARRYGTNETLHRLIVEAHAREMKVILDFVANHTSTEHPLFRRAQAEPHSPLRQWYTFGDYPPYGYRTYALVPSMPELATEHPDVRRYLATAAEFWLSDLGADGLRLDYVSGPSPAFWTLFQHGLKERFPQALTLGEVTEAPADLAIYAGRMDAAMDFALAARLRRVFARREEPLVTLLDFLDARARTLVPEFGRATLLDNHDMNRFLWLAEGDKARLRLAATCQMTLDGTPILYYGTEVGLSQTADAAQENAFARAPMLWGADQDHEILAHYHALCALRRGHPALRHGSRTRLPVTVLDGPGDATEQVGAYLRWSDTEYLVVVLNNAQAPVRARIALTAGPAEGLALPPVFGHRLGSAATGELPVTDDAVVVDLPALEAAVLGPQ
ncbi:MAG: DUF3459 domain-containing protein [Ktedonobacterales bacterium]|nr:DUF3459 domain-containing protein [Ktedonobacterales bacterium]